MTVKRLLHLNLNSLKRGLRKIHCIFNLILSQYLKVFNKSEDLFESISRMNTRSGSDNEGQNFRKAEMENKIPHSGSDNAIDDLVKSDSKIPLKIPNKDGESDIQVKFNISDSVNGKGKCIAENALPSFSGLSKEELLKYANDPFWVRMRLFLFIFFWAVWIAMFVGAIVIIVMAPKCDPPKKPEWYEQGPLYEVDIAKFVSEENDNLLQHMISRLNYLSTLKIQGVILSPLFKTDGISEENVVDYKSIDDKFGTLEDFQMFVSKAKEKDIHIILSFTPNYSSDKHSWFNKSIAKESPFKDYYVWSSGVGINSDGSKQPPNNWLSLKDGSAWEWVEERQEFYLHQFEVNQPDFNFHNPLVLKEMEDIFSFWIDLGVSGFNLDKVQYLLEDSNFQDEVPGGKPGTVHTQYEFYSHKKTHNNPAVADILSSWRQLIHEKTAGKGILIVTGDVPIPTDSNLSTIIVDIKRSDKLLKNLPKNFTAKDLYPKLLKIMNSVERWPSVQLGDRYMSRVADLFGEENVDGLNMITLLLPATPITYFGEELGLSDQTSFKWGNETNSVSAQQEATTSHYKIYKALVEARDTQTVLYGNSTLQIINDSVLVFTLIKLGNPGYLVAYNPSSHNITVDLSNLDFIPSDLMMYTKSVNFPLTMASTKDKIKSKSVFLPGKSGIVFTFAPKTEE